MLETRQEQNKVDQSSSLVEGIQRLAHYTIRKEVEALRKLIKRRRRSI